MPSANYDIRLLNQHGVDQLQGVGANRSALAAEQVAVIYASTSLHPAIDEGDTLTLVIDNNFAVSGQLTVELLYALGY